MGVGFFILHILSILFIFCLSKGVMPPFFIGNRGNSRVAQATVAQD
jgi:hypothetical protein